MPLMHFESICTSIAKVLFPFMQVLTRLRYLITGIGRHIIFFLLNPQIMTQLIHIPKSESWEDVGIIQKMQNKSKICSCPLNFLLTVCLVGIVDSSLRHFGFLQANWILLRSWVAWGLEGNFREQQGRINA